MRSEGSATADRAPDCSTRGLTDVSVRESPPLNCGYYTRSRLDRLGRSCYRPNHIAANGRRPCDPSRTQESSCSRTRLACTCGPHMPIMSRGKTAEIPSRTPSPMSSGCKPHHPATHAAKFARIARRRLARLHHAGPPHLTARLPTLCHMPTAQMHLNAPPSASHHTACTRRCGRRHRHRPLHRAAASSEIATSD